MTWKTYCCHAEVDPSDKHPSFTRCKCPECGERTGSYDPALVRGRSAEGQLCPVTDLPEDSTVRLRVFQWAVAWALNDGRCITKRMVLDRLDLDESKAKTVQRALSDACDAGWIELYNGDTAYQRGPLTENIVSERTSGVSETADKEDT
jgi:hypothetical protein